MRTKVLFLLSLCCFFASFGLLVGSCTRSSGGRIHAGTGEEISFCVLPDETGDALIYVVPFGKRLIITDIIGMVGAQLAADPDGVDVRGRTLNIGDVVNMTSGIVFYGGEQVWLLLPGAAWVTLAGYLVDG